MPVAVDEPRTGDLPWHALDPEEVAASLQTDIEAGLSAVVVAARQRDLGPNVVVQSRGRGRFERFGNQFRDVLIWLLIAAALTSGLVLGAWIDAAVIGAIVILNAAIGFAQESRADAALEELKDMEAPEATVVRDGSVCRIQARELVPGDVLVLESGAVVPADGRVFKGARLVLDEASLTGESMPVSKGIESCALNTVVADRTSMVHAGTAVVGGRGAVVVTSIGKATEMGRIASLFDDAAPQTPLQQELARIGRRLALVAVLSALVVFVAGVARSVPVESMVLLAVALAVAAIPEGLPAVVTVSLAGGLQRMAHRNAVVRRLPAVEALGAVDVVCTDKTGTLTSPSLEVGEVIRADGRSGLDHTRDQTLDWLIAVAYLCNDAQRIEATWEGDPTEVALREAVEAAVPLPELRSLERRLPRIDEASFDGRRKRMSTLHESDEGLVLLVKGAPEVILSRSTAVFTNGAETTFSSAGRELSLATAERLAARGMRTLALAFRRVDPPCDDPAEAEDNLTFLGTVGLRETVRPEVPKALAAASSAGVRTVMVTGDHATTASAVADSVGIPPGDVMEGRVLAETSVEELGRSIDTFRVFARVDPADKVKIIEAWQGRGAKVAMTGDGVNDAPALHRADIGVAMGSGTDVARESAAMVLTDDNYATIVAAIGEGRRLFANLRNVVHYLLSSNASEVLFVLTAFVAFGSLGVPVTAVQLLWINLISDAMPAIALGMDRPSRDLMRDPPGVGRDVLAVRNLVVLLVQGAIMAAAAVFVFAGGTYWLEISAEGVRTMVFSTLVFTQLLHALSVRAGSLSSGPKTARPGPMLLLAVGGSALVHLGVVYSSLGQQVFGTVGLGFVPMIWTLGATLIATILVRVFNRIIRSMC